MNGAASHPEIPGPQSGARRWRWLWLAAFFAAGLLTRGWHMTMDFDHPDEPIAIGVNHWLDHSWDTNWKLASLPDPFNYDQYNFSSYFLVVHGWNKVAAPLFPKAWSTERGGVLLMRALSVLCGALAVAWTFFVGERVGGRTVAVVGALLVLANPQLTADGHYARPEALLTWLALVVVWLALADDFLDWRWRLAGSAFLVGFMLAAKVTMGLLLVAPLWIAWKRGQEPLPLPVRSRQLDGALLSAAALTLIGFGAGVPGALANPGAFINGVEVLARQYGGFHEPHSDYAGGRCALVLGSFYLVTVGALAVGLMIGGVVRWWRQRNWAGLALLAVPVVLYAGYFATKRVFFERNLSHALPLAFLLAGAGTTWLGSAVARESGWRSRAVLVLVALLAAAPGAAVTVSLLTRALSGDDARSFEKQTREIRARYADIEWRPVNLLFSANLQTLRKDFAFSHKPILIQYQEFNDSYSRHYGEILDREFVTFDAGTIDEALSDLPCSTLNVYHGPRTVLKVVTGKRWLPVTKR